MTLMGMLFKNQKRTLARKQSMTLFRKQNLMLYRKKSSTLFWKQKNRRYFGRHKGCYLGSKKVVCLDALSFVHDMSHLASSLTTQCKKNTLKREAKWDSNSRICCSDSYSEDGKYSSLT